LPASKNLHNKRRSPKLLLTPAINPSRLLLGSSLR
jgi:hypothetical protein